MRLLIVGPLSGDLAAAARMAQAKGAELQHADDIGAALRGLRAGSAIDLVICDLSCDIAALIAGLGAERFHLPVVAAGVNGTDAAALAAIRAGAKEFLPLPPDPDLIAAILQAAAGEDHALIARDPAMLATLRRADQIAGSPASVLIAGESGTGKEVLARYIHRKSPRARGSFVALNCAAIPETLLESELFGHEKGAFSGAVARRIGKFEAADGGTLLLDEISEMDIRLQAKLLRALQEREIDRVGGASPVRVNVRIIATTNRRLADEIKAGRFREDLYFRLNVVSMALPGLRERPADIVAIARHFAAKYAAVNGLADRPLAPAAERRLAGHAWPGNIRELENTIHRAVLLAEGDAIGAEAIELGAIELGQPHSSPPAAGQAANQAATQGMGPTGGIAAFVGRSVGDVERDLILETLGHCLGNRTHAATILGISIRALRNKLRDYAAQGIAVPKPASGVAA